eukprot:m.178296 g.178296  ORF g.178296 m.178296 type:complete len:304 (-) comp14517_c0_seq1:1-912(-)
MEHSRSLRYTQLPCWSASTWISMCRGAPSRYLRTIMSWLPNAMASPLQMWYASLSSASLYAARIPLPPPPCTALIITGYPNLCAISTACSGLCTIVLSPGIWFTPASSATIREFFLSPMTVMACFFGPRNLIPLASSASEKSAFSDRNPYPGWTASTLCSSMASRILSMRRYDSAVGAGPRRAFLSARRTCSASASASLYTATVSIPSFLADRITRHAISPRLATMSVLIPGTSDLHSRWCVDRARSTVRWSGLRTGSPAASRNIAADMALPSSVYSDCVQLLSSVHVKVSTPGKRRIKCKNL